MMYGLFCRYSYCDYDDLLRVFNTKEDAEKVKNEIESFPEVLPTLKFEGAELFIGEVAVVTGSIEGVAKTIIHENLWDM